MPEPHSAAQCSLQLDQGDTYGNCEKSGTQEGCRPQEGRCEEGSRQEGRRQEARRQEGCSQEGRRQACPCEKGRCSSRRQDHAEPSGCVALPDRQQALMQGGTLSN